MTPSDRLITLPPTADASQALRMLARYEIDQIPIVEQGELKGLVRRQDLVKWFGLRMGALLDRKERP
jgi:CBS domain-containing protein